MKRTQNVDFELQLRLETGWVTHVMLQVEVNWGTGLGGLFLQIAVRGILAVGEEARYTVNWRPQLLCLSKPRSSWTDKGHADHEFLFFTSQLKKVRCQSMSYIKTPPDDSLPRGLAHVQSEHVFSNDTHQSKIFTITSHVHGRKD